jgi:Tol biopolymer transport system component/DNA-binding winged helix-turn-helix (wHTH) protein
MAPAQQRFVEFGRFRFDLTDRALSIGRIRVPLAPMAADILAHLATHSGEWVSREELKGLFWGSARVEDNTVDRHISAIRAALRTHPKGDSVLERKYKKGWRLAARVPEPKSSLRWRAWLIAPLLGVTCIAAVLMLNRPVNTGPKITAYTRLTRDDEQKRGPLLTDGRRIFFTEQIGNSSRVASIAPTGGVASFLDVPYRFAVNDVTSDGNSLLLAANDGHEQLWIYQSLGHSIQPLNAHSSMAARSPDGEVLATVGHDHALRVTNTAGDETRADLPGLVVGFRWAPDGKRIRVVLRDPKTELSSFWDVDRRGNHSRRVREIPSAPSIGTGDWTPDGKYFAYPAGTQWHADLWVIGDTSRRGPLSYRAHRLTNGSQSWRWPVWGNWQTLFAISDSPRSELVRYKRNLGCWIPEWDGAAAYELDFHRDGRQVAYIQYPSHTLWRAYADGSKPIQLTGAGIEAHQPHWSPDGSKIAFMGKPAGKWRVFVIAVRGGAPQELFPGGGDQGVPTFAADGHTLVYGERGGQKHPDEMCVHLADLKTRTTRELTGSRGFWSPRWSPDGSNILAVSTDSKQLVTFSWPECRKTIQANLSFINNATWSIDSRYIYFDGQRDIGHIEVFRLNVAQHKLEHLSSWASFDAEEEWFGVAPNGDPLALRSRNSQDIWALKCVLP